MDMEGGGEEENAAGCGGLLVSEGWAMTKAMKVLIINIAICMHQ